MYINAYAYKQSAVKIMLISARCDTERVSHTPFTTIILRFEDIRMEVSSSRPDYLPTLSAGKTFNLSLLVKHHMLAIDEAS